MGRLAAPISDYVTDTKSVLDQSLRVLQAMTDVSADAGWLDTALVTMMLVQSLMQVCLLAASPPLVPPPSLETIITPGGVQLLWLELPVDVRFKAQLRRPAYLHRALCTYLCGLAHVVRASIDPLCCPCVCALGLQNLQAWKLSRPARLVLYMFGLLVL